MKSLLIMIVGKNPINYQESVLNESGLNQNCFKANDVKEAYDLSFKYDFDMVIVNKGFEDFEEEKLITFLNEKNASTIFIPYVNSLKNRIKRRIKALTIEEHLTNLVPCNSSLSIPTH